MPSINPAVKQWIRQMGDSDQVVAYYAYQCLLEEVLSVSKPGQEAAQAVLANVLGGALVAQAKPGQGARSRQLAASFRNNIFLTAVSKDAAEPLHAAHVRNNLARLLSYIPNEATVPHLARAMNDLEAREMARFALERNSSERATDALIAALDSVGPTFCVGVVNSLAKRKGEKVSAALRKAAENQQSEVRVAAVEALAGFPDPAHDAIIEKSAKAASPEERRRAHVARARLAETLRASGNKQAAERIYREILASDADEPQKKAARLALTGRLVGTVPVPRQQLSG